MPSCATSPFPASQPSLSGLANQEYFYCLTATAEWFEIGASYIHDGRFRLLQVDTSNTGSHIFAVERRSGITRTAESFPTYTSETPIQGGFNAADVVFGSSSNANAEIGNVLATEGEVYKIYTHYPTVANETTPGTYDQFVNGEQVVDNGAPANTGYVLQTTTPQDETGISFVKLETISGSISDTNEFVVQDSNAIHTVGAPSDRFLINVSKGSFATGDWFFSKVGSLEGYMDNYVSKSGSLTNNEGG